jgi:NAD(P)-dependent dehydrogenase (short-subunit alcohol dehydrogenase family)
VDQTPRDPLARDPQPLRGRSVVVTGVSRRAGIGYAVACTMAAYGANVFCHHFAPHDRAQPWGGDDVAAVLAGVRDHLVGDARVADLEADLGDPDAPERTIAAAIAAFGRVDALVCNQALSGADGALGDLTAADLDRHWAVDARASILLAQAFAARSDGRGGAIVFAIVNSDRRATPGLGQASGAAGLPVDHAQGVVDLGAGGGRSFVEATTWPPEVTTSSTTSTRRPSTSAPSARRRVPYAFASLRTKAAGMPVTCDSITASGTPPSSRPASTSVPSGTSGARASASDRSRPGRPRSGTCRSTRG